MRDAATSALAFDGAGQSLAFAFFAGHLVSHPRPNAPDRIRVNATRVGGATMRRWLRSLEVLLLAGAFAHATLDVARMPRWTVDDAWIVARYAENLVRHGVLSYNIGGPRVEGFTSPLYALVAIVSVAAGWAALPVAKALGVAGYLASGTLLVAFARELRVPAPVGGVVAFAYMAVPDHVRHAASGLETELYLAIEIFCGWAFVRALRGSNPRGCRALVGACSLICFARPEGFAIAGILLGLVARRVWSTRERSPRRMPCFLRIVAIGLAPVTVGIAARVVYFHSLLPNTFFAKRAPWNWAYLRDIAGLADSNFLDFVILAGGAFAVARILGVSATRLAPRRAALLVAAGTILAAYVLAYSHTDLLMNYGHRFAIHGLPWIALAVIVLLGQAGFYITRLRTRSALAALILACIPMLLLWSRVHSSEAQCALERGQMKVYAESIERRYLPVAKYLTDHLPSTATLAVYPDAGIVPYRTGLRTLDFGRLNDLYLARQVRAPAEVASYFFAQTPDALLASFVAGRRPWDDGEAAIVESPAFADRYEVALRDLTERGGIILYMRKR